jgi:hypothetical protein
VVHRPRRPRLRAAAAAAILGTVGLPAGAVPSSLVFRDLSTASGGPVDMGSPTSFTEKVGCAFVDTDGDGWDELIALAGTGHPFAYLRNISGEDGRRTLAPMAPGHGLDSAEAVEREGTAICAGDIDNDGDTDLFVGCGKNDLVPDGRNLLLLNDGTGRFTDAAPALGVAGGQDTTTACLFTDFDLDGDLDLVFANANMANLGKAGDGRTRLFRNTLAELGALGFVEESDERLVTEVNTGPWATVAFDADGDGDDDILHTRDITGPTQLYRNDGSGRFEDASAQSGSGEGDDATPSTFGDDTPNAMGVAVADPDCDGDLDIYITDVETHCYYRNNGDGTFTERGASAGIRGGFVGWGASFADFDLDGWPDLYAAAGDLYTMDRDIVRPFLYRNLGGGTFAEMDLATAGIRHDPPLHRENGTAVSDFDGDGDPDLLVVRAHRHTGASPYLYRNDSPTAGNRWIAVRLRGDGLRSNRDAVGAVVRVWGRDAAGALVPGAGQAQALLSSSSRGSVSSFELLFGLGPDAVVADVQILWPRSGSLASRTSVFPGRSVDTRHRFDDIPGAAPAALVPGATTAAVGGADSVVPIPGGEGPNAPHPLVVRRGPAWAVVEGDAQSGWSLRLRPPVADAVRIERIELEGGKAPTLSTQVHEVSVVSPPFVTSAEPRSRASRIDLAGGNFPEDACTVLVDGVPAKRVRYPGVERDADGDHRLLRVNARRAPRGAVVRTVVVASGTTGLEAPPVEVPVRAPRVRRSRAGGDR